MSKPVAVITGASSGLGVVFARKLAPTHDLVLVARRRERLDALAAQLAAECGCAATSFPADLSDESGIALVADLISGEEKLDLLINNAGFGSLGLFWESNLEVQEQMYRLHIAATVRLSHAALRRMVARNAGAIVNVASVAGFFPRAGSASYGSTKSWMIAFTEALHLELVSIRSAVKVQALCPGFTYTEFHDTLNMDRHTIAAPSFWLRPEKVVDASLRALAKGKLLVIPGWRYKVLVAVATKLPAPLLRVLGTTRSANRHAGK